MGEIVVKEKRKKGGSDDEPRMRKPTRAAISIDMTPMVDVAFLLLIFFMVTTVFRRPLAMEVNMPEPGATVKVPESNVLTLYVLEDDRIVSRMGRDRLTPIGWGDLEGTLRRSSETNAKLIVLVKLDPRARYERMVDMMDVLDNAHVTRFSLVPMTALDLQAMGGGR